MWHNDESFYIAEEGTHPVKEGAGILPSLGQRGHVIDCAAGALFGGCKSKRIY